MALFSRKGSIPPQPGQTVGGNIGELLEEIAAGPQQRRFTLSLGGAEVVIDTSNREVVAVVSVTPPTLPGADAVDIKARDDDELEAQLSTIGALFAAVQALPGSMRLTSVAAPLRYSTKLQGFSRDELTRATRAAVRAAKAAAPPPPRDPESRAQSAPTRPLPAAPAEPAAVSAPETEETLFFRQVASAVTGAIVIDRANQVIARQGAVADIDPLRDSILKDFGNWQTAVDGVIPGPKLLVLRGVQANDAIFCVHVGKNVLTVATCGAASLGRILSLIA